MKKRLEYINYWIFKYTENYFFSPRIKSILEEDEKLQMLSQENYGVSNLGYILGPDDLLYEEVKSSEITNLLIERF